MFQVPGINHYKAPYGQHPHFLPSLNFFSMTPQFAAPLKKNSGKRAEVVQQEITVSPPSSPNKKDGWKFVSNSHIGLKKTQKHYRDVFVFQKLDPFFLKGKIDVLELQTKKGPGIDEKATNPSGDFEIPQSDSYQQTLPQRKIAIYQNLFVQEWIMKVK